MRIGGVGAARFHHPVHIPAVRNEGGELVSPASTDLRVRDVPVDLGPGSGSPADWSPPQPAGLNVFANVAATSAGAGAGRQSQGQGQGRQGSHSQDSTIIVTDQNGTRHELDMAKPGRVRIGGLMFETGGSAPQSRIGRLIGEARKFLGF